jgi:CubicO group peptidase (beta-lactamase class C family)
MPWFSRLPRRLLIAASVAALLGACGGGDDPAPPPAYSVQQTADEAVRDGLVGVVFEHLTATQAQEGVAGLRQAGGSAHLQRDDWFLIGSTTKAMTAEIAARLVERGTIAWTTTLAEALPDLAPGMREAYRGITLEQLLAHRGGVVALTGDEDFDPLRQYVQAHADDLPDTLAGRERFVAAWVLSQPSPAGVVPGRDFAYSNAGFALAAMMLEARSGLSYAQLFEQELAQPLGVDVRWTPADQPVADGPTGHVGAKGQLAPEPLVSADEAPWVEVLRPAGFGLTITPQGYAAWVRWHLLALQGRPTPLPAGYVQRLKTLQANDYALGWGAFELGGRRALGHTGQVGGFNSEVVIDGEGRSASFVLTNTTSDSDPSASWVLQLIGNALLEIERKLPPAP